MTPVLAVIDDIFFLAKVQGTAKQAGVPLKIISAANFNLETVRREKPSLLIVDLNAKSGDVLEAIGQLKTDSDLRDVPVVAFLSHVQTELQQAAQEAGADQVMPRSQFSANLPQILREYIPAG